MNNTTDLDLIRQQIMLSINNNTLALPSLPSVLINIDRALDNDRSSLSYIAKLIQNDTSIASRVLQISNSPALRGFNKIDSIDEAIGRLGISMVKNIVMATSMRDKFSSNNPELNELLNTYFDHSIELSGLSYYLAKRNKDLRIFPERINLSGILFSLGKLPVIKFFEKNVFDDIATVDFVANNLRLPLNKLILSKWDLSFEVFKDICSSEISTNDKSVSDILLICDAFLNKNEVILELQNSFIQRIWDDLSANYDEDIASINSLKYLLKT